MHVTKTQKLVFGHAHSSLVHISLLSCHVVFCGLVVIAIASEGRDTEFDSIPLELPAARQRNLMHTQPERDLKKVKRKKVKKSPKMELKTIINPYHYINTNEIPCELLRKNMISSHMKITCYFHR